jgi:membrane fusion protein (multidrug efflux system)
MFRMIMEDSVKKWGVLALVSVTFVSAMGWWFWPRTPNQTVDFRAPILVEAEPVKIGPISRQVSTNGSLVASQSVVVFPQMDGKISEIVFDQGSVVKKDDILVRLDDSIVQAQFREAQARLSVAQNEHKRQKYLYERNFSAKAAMEKAQAEMNVQEAALKVAQVHLDQTVIRAPFDGTVGLKNISPGSTVARNTELLTIVALEPIYIDFPVPDSFLKDLHVSDKVDVMVEGFDSLPMEATIVAIDAEANPGTHSVKVRAEMANPSEALKPGQFARVTLNLGEEESAVLIPIVAAEKEGDSYFVYKIVDHVAVMTEVSLGLRENGAVQVTDGLSKGDVVVVVGQTKLVDGARVRLASEEKQLATMSGKEDKSAQEGSWLLRFLKRG